MLSNAHFLAKVRFDTAENEPARISQNLNLAILPILLTLTPNADDALGLLQAHGLRGEVVHVRRGLLRRDRVAAEELELRVP